MHIRFSVVCSALVYYSLVYDRHQHHILACFCVILFTCLLLTCLLPIHLIGVQFFELSSFYLWFLFLTWLFFSYVLATCLVFILFASHFFVAHFHIINFVHCNCQIFSLKSPKQFLHQVKNENSLCVYTAIFQLFICWVKGNAWSDISITLI